MEKSQARELLRNAQIDRQDARESQKVAQATIEVVAVDDSGVLKRFPELAEEEKEWEDQWELKVAESTQRPLRGAEAVLSVLQVEEDRWFSVVDMVESLEEQGLLPESTNPPNAVRAALERLVAVDDGHVVKGRPFRNQNVMYRYHEAEKAITTAPSVPVDSGYGYSEEPF